MIRPINASRLPLLVCIALGIILPICFTCGLSGQTPPDLTPESKPSADALPAPPALGADSSSPTSVPDAATNAATPQGSSLAQISDNSIPLPLVASAVVETNDPSGLSTHEKVERLKQQLGLARYYRTMRRNSEAQPMLVALLADDTPDDIKKSALLELAAIPQEENDLGRAQQVYAQFLSHWPDDPRIPEILLRQGDLFRQMGLNNLALTKYYAVMTSALVLKNDRMDYYAHIVLQAQVEIAETHYQLGKYDDAADFFSRLLKQNNPALNKSEIFYKLLRCQSALGKYEAAVATGQDFLSRYMNAPEQPEVRFYLAEALKQLGRNNDSLLQVLTLLREQSAHAGEHPEAWIYWQQRTGNVIANQLYREGDYSRALDIYTGLIQMDSSPAWQLPVQYQIGMTYEHLWQPQKAIQTYNAILSRESELGTNAPPSLKNVLDMARWRIGFIQWQGKAESATHEFHPAETNATIAASLSPGTTTTQ